MQNKKSGIRLRHLQQQLPLQPQKKRDVSPNTSNRKKIFEKVSQQKNTEKQQFQNRANVPISFAQNHQGGEYEKLIENLKRKSMQVELRDNMIKNLNHEIDELKRELQSKDRQIVKLKGEINRLQRTSKLSKQIQQENNFIQSFKDSEIYSKKRVLQEEYVIRNNFEPSKHQNINKMTHRPSQEISMMNMQLRPSPSAQLRSEQPEILSPFMALANKKADGDTLINQLPIQRQHSQTFHGYSGNMTGNSFQISSNTNKSNLTNPFEKYAPKKYLGNGNNTSVNSSFAKKPLEVQYSRQQARKVVQGDNNVEKFNIFGKNDLKSQVRQVTKLQIEDSRQFKFQDFGNDYNQF